MARTQALLELRWSLRLRKTIVAVQIAALLGVFPGLARADTMGSGLGAIRGAVIGDIVGGGHGAAAGAAIGAMIGAPGTAAREQVYMDRQRAAADARLAQWEAERRQRELEAMERREQAERRAAISSEPDLDLLLDTQRALMSLGYDPGPIGMTSPELTTSIVKYQESQGLLPNGSMTPGLLDRMVEDAE